MDQTTKLKKPFLEVWMGGLEGEMDCGPVGISDRLKMMVENGLLPKH